MLKGGNSQRYKALFFPLAFPPWLILICQKSVGVEVKSALQQFTLAQALLTQQNRAQLVTLTLAVAVKTAFLMDEWLWNNFSVHIKHQ